MSFGFRVRVGRPIGQVLVKALWGCSNPKLNELERYLFGVLGK